MAKKKKPEVVIDRALKRRWTDALAELEKARAGESTGWDETYEALGAILDADPPLYLAGGFKTARAFLQKYFPDQDERTVRTYVRVAAAFEPDDEKKYGTTRLAYLLDYLAALGGAPLPPAKIHPERQKVRVRLGKVTRRIPFAQATAGELRAAVRAAHSPAHSATQPPLVRAIKTRLGAKHLRAVAVSLRGGQLTLTLPPDRLSDLCRALAGFKPAAAKR